jgi:hypothetical protein
MYIDAVCFCEFFLETVIYFVLDDAQEAWAVFDAPDAVLHTMTVLLDEFGELCAGFGFGNIV